MGAGRRLGLVDLVRGIARRGAARWFYLNARFVAAVLLHRVFGGVSRWAERQADKRSAIKDADRRMVEILIPGFPSIARLGKHDFAVEALINSRLRGLPLIRISDSHRSAYSRFERHTALFRRPYRALICVPWLRSGGADKVAANLAHALSDLYGPKSVAVVVLDYSRAFVRKRYPREASVSSWFPKGVAIIDLSDTTDIDRSQRLEILANIFLSV